MDAKEYLTDVAAIRFKLKTIDNEIKEMIDMSQSAGAMDYSRERVMGGEESQLPSFSKMLEKIDIKLEEYEAMRVEYVETSERALKQIHMLSDGIDMNVIYEKFFENKTLKKIAKEMYFSFDSVYYHYKKGLKEFNARKLWEA